MNQNGKKRRQYSPIPQKVRTLLILVKERANITR